MARYFVDVVNGLDSNAGTEGAPFATITKAITTATGASDIVVVESGIYREQITFQGAGGVTGPQYIIARGRVIVDGEDVRHCMATGASVLGGANDRRILGTWINFIFRNPLNNVYINIASTGVAHAPVFHNCVWYDITSNTTGYIFDSSFNPNISCSMRFYRCTFKRFGSIDRNGVTPNANWTTYVVKHSIIELTNTFGSKTPTSDSENAYAGGAFVNTSVNAPVYTDETYGVSEDLSLLRSNASNQTNYLAKGTTTGQELSDLGASWHPQFGNHHLWEATDKFGADPMNDEEWATDTNYDNGTDQGPALKAADDSFWTVDTITQPSAITAAVVSPVWKVPVQNGRTATLKSATWLANEDTAPASGQKDVVDADAGATRTIQYRHSETQFAQQDASGGAVPAWTAIDRDDILVATHNVNFWIQVRVILTLEGD